MACIAKPVRCRRIVRLLEVELLRISIERKLLRGDPVGVSTEGLSTRAYSIRGPRILVPGRCFGSLGRLITILLDGRSVAASSTVEKWGSKRERIRVTCDARFGKAQKT